MSTPWPPVPILLTVCSDPARVAILHLPPAMPAARKMRLDQLLVSRGLAVSREKAQAMILAGEVSVEGSPVTKSGHFTREGARIEIRSRLQKYVSRGGFKLEGALQDFLLDPSGRTCLDLGSSNGGFTDCLLQHGAARVYAVDVNTAQLDWKLQQHPGVVQIKRNARDLRPSDLPSPASLIVADVSFISVTKILPAAVGCAAGPADFLILIKPQFELRRQDIGAGGIVSDSSLHEKAIRSVEATARSLDLQNVAVKPSCLPGAEGNLEFFLHSRKS